MDKLLFRAGVFFSEKVHISYIYKLKKDIYYKGLYSATSYMQYYWTTHGVSSLMPLALCKQFFTLQKLYI